MSLVREVVIANERQKEEMVRKLERLLGGVRGKRICVLGLSFKAETDDVRESPAIIIIKKLLQEGAKVQAHDPQAIPNARKILGEKVQYFDDMYQAMEKCDALCILTEWNSYRNLDLDIVKSNLTGRVILDTRNVLDPELVKEKGFIYEGVGRK